LDRYEPESTAGTYISALKPVLTYPRQPLSLLLKSCQHVTELALYDVVNTPGVAADLSHISTPAV